MALSLDECIIKYVFNNKIMGETIQKCFKIFYKSDELDVLETVSPILIVENIKGDNFKFACAVAISFSLVKGDIQMCYIERSKDSNIVELTVYYSKNFVIDEKMRESIIFEHIQRNHVFKYLSKTDLDKNATLYI